MEIDETTPLIARLRANVDETDNDNDIHHNVPQGGIASKALRARHRGLLVAWSTLLGTLGVLRGQDERLQKDTVRELRGILAISALTITSALFQVWILPMFHLQQYLGFGISIGVSEIINSVVEWYTSRHARAFGAALTTHIVQYVFVEVGKVTDRKQRVKRLALVKESLRKSDGLGNFLFAFTKLLQVSISVCIGVVVAAWPWIGFWSIPIGFFTTAVFVGGLIFTQWSLSWKNAEQVNESRSSLNHQIIERHAPRAEALVNSEAGPILEASPELVDPIAARDSIDVEAVFTVADALKLERDPELDRALTMYLMLAQKQAMIELTRRHLLQLLIFVILLLTHDTALCVRLWRDCQALDGVFQKLINSIAQQSVVREVSTLDQALSSLNHGYKFMVKAEVMFWSEVKSDIAQTLSGMKMFVSKMSRQLLSLSRYGRLSRTRPELGEVRPRET